MYRLFSRPEILSLHLPPSHLPCPFFALQPGSFHLANSCVGVGSVCVRSVVQSCPSLLDPMNCSPPGSSVHEIFQARILEWVAIFSSRGSFWPRDPACISCISCIGRRILYQLCHLESPGVTIQPSNSTPQHITKRIENKCLPQNLCMNVHSSTIYNIYKVEITQKSIYWGTDK